MALLHYNTARITRRATPYIVPRRREAVRRQKKTTKPLQLEFRVCFVHENILRERRMRGLNGVFFNEILQEFATQFARSAGKDIV